MKKQSKRGMLFKMEYDAFIKSRRTYVGLVAILEDKLLSPQARLLFQIISSLSYVEGYCYATNDTLCSKLGLQKTSIKKYLDELVSLQIINRKIVPCNNGKRRELFLDFDILKSRYFPKD